jgi:hypothetical protein
MQTEEPKEPSYRIQYLILCLLIAQIIVATIMSFSLPAWLGYSNPNGTADASLPLTIIGMVMTVLALSTIAMASKVKKAKSYERFVIAVSLLVLTTALVGFLVWATQGTGSSG